MKQQQSRSLVASSLQFGLGIQDPTQPEFPFGVDPTSIGAPGAFDNDTSTAFIAAGSDDSPQPGPESYGYWNGRTLNDPNDENHHE